MNSMNKSDVRNNEEGIVAILVTMIIMIVITLIVTGFAQLARREQRTALDNQLNTQAFYAAESAINDVKHAQEAGLGDNSTDCSGAAGLSGDGAALLSSLSNALTADGTIQYSCLLVKNNVTETINAVSTSSAETMSAYTYNSPGDTATDASELTFTWAPSSGPLALWSAPGFPDLPNATTWNTGNSIGMLRIDIVPVPAANITPTGLSDGMFTVFGYPHISAGGGGTATYGGNASGDNGKVVKASCSTGDDGVCTLTVSGLPAGTNHFYVRLKAIYNAVTVKIQARNVSSETLTIKGAQTEIDATGRANDVLKRIKVRVSSKTEDGLHKMIRFPEFAVDSKDAICKNLETEPTTTTNSCTP